MSRDIVIGDGQVVRIGTGVRGGGGSGIGVGRVVAIVAIVLQIIECVGDFATVAVGVCDFGWVGMP